MSRLFTALRDGVVGLWHAVEFARRALFNLLFVLILLALIWAALRPGPGPIPPKTTLVLDLQGPLREQFSGSARDNALRQARGQPVNQTRLRDVLTALEAASKDPAIARVLLLTDDFAGAGPATLREVAAALQRVRTAGKPVWAWGSSYSQASYYLAAHADQVYLHPMGGVQVEGYGGHRLYFREAFDRFGITPHVLRAGRYKNAGETWVASGPSPETLEEERSVMDALWALYTGGVERARKLDAGAVGALIDALPERLAAVKGDSAALAVQSRLVDALKTRDELRAMLVQAGAPDDSGKTFRQVTMPEYLSRIPHGQRRDVVGIVIAEGGIRDGDAPPGAVGGDSTAALIRRAREDERIRALVLRVDSPGGSAFASELIRRELELTRAAGKPVVVSMGDVAASGGYWISMASDEVIADPATITGSIGVITMFPGVHEALGQLGLRTGGYTTTWLAGASDPTRPLDPRLAAVMQAGIDHTYADFTGKVAAARKRSVSDIDAVAQGRIWTGEQARERGLVDRTGSLADAIESAAKRAKLAPDTWQLGYVEVPPGRFDQLFSLLASNFGVALPGLSVGADVEQLLALARAVVAPQLRAEQGGLGETLRALAESRPGASWVHCLCGDP